MKLATLTAGLRHLALGLVLSATLPAALAADPAAAPAPAPAASAAASPAAAPVSIAAAGPIPSHATQATPPASPSAGMFQILFGLIVVLGLMAAAAWLLRRTAGVRMAAGHNIRVVGGVAVGTRERVVVVEVADQWVVVGVAPGQVNSLATMPRQEGAAAAESGPTAGAPNFSAWLKQTIEKRNGERNGQVS